MSFGIPRCFKVFVTPWCTSNQLMWQKNAWRLTQPKLDQYMAIFVCETPYFYWSSSSNIIIYNHLYSLYTSTFVSFDPLKKNGGQKASELVATDPNSVPRTTSKVPSRMMKNLSPTWHVHPKSHMALVTQFHRRYALAIHSLDNCTRKF